MPPWYLQLYNHWHGLTSSEALEWLRCCASVPSKNVSVNCHCIEVSSRPSHIHWLLALLFLAVVAVPKLRQYQNQQFFFMCYQNAECPELYLHNFMLWCWSTRTFMFSFRVRAFAYVIYISKRQWWLVFRKCRPQPAARISSLNEMLTPPPFKSVIFFFFAVPQKKLRLKYLFMFAENTHYFSNTLFCKVQHSVIMYRVLCIQVFQVSLKK